MTLAFGIVEAVEIVDAVAVVEAGGPPRVIVPMYGPVLGSFQGVLVVVVDGAVDLRSRRSRRRRVHRKG